MQDSLSFKAECWKKKLSFVCTRTYHVTFQMKQNDQRLQRHTAQSTSNKIIFESTYDYTKTVCKKPDRKLQKSSVKYAPKLFASSFNTVLKRTKASISQWAQPDVLNSIPPASFMDLIKENT